MQWDINEVHGKIHFCQASRIRIEDHKEARLDGGLRGISYYSIYVLIVPTGLLVLRTTAPKIVHCSTRRGKTSSGTGSERIAVR